MVRAVVVLILLALLPSGAHAEKRVALVIGNSAYKHTGELPNPKNDAGDMAAALKKLGFQVVDGFDLDKGAMERKIREFARTLAGSDVGLLFFAGHGLQVAGANYLVPIDAKLEDASGLDFELVRLDLVQRTMERETRTNILFLDACRDNPLARNLARAMGTRSAAIGRGLAQVEAGGGTLISYSTQPGNVALDGTGRNSPFAGALVKHIVAPGVDVGALLIKVRRDVMQETQNRQVPWEHSALTDAFYFNITINVAPQPVAPVPAPALRLSEAAEAWDRTKDTTNAAVLERFIARYKDTFYAELARARIEEVKKQQLVTIAPLPKPKAALEAEPGRAPPQLNQMPLALNQNSGIVGEYYTSVQAGSAEECRSACLARDPCVAMDFGKSCRLYRKVIRLDPMPGFVSWTEPSRLQAKATAARSGADKAGASRRAEALRMGFRLDTGIDGELHSVHDARSPEDCRSACLANDQCKAVDYGKRCRFYRKVIKESPMSGFVSWVK